MRNSKSGEVARLKQQLFDSHNEINRQNPVIMSLGNRVKSLESEQVTLQDEFSRRIGNMDVKSRNDVLMLNADWKRVKMEYELKLSKGREEVVKLHLRVKEGESLLVTKEQQMVSQKQVSLNISLALNFSILAVSCVIWSGALDSSGVLQPYSIISLA